MTDQSPEGIATTSIPQDRDLYTIPSHSSWFRWDEIHDTERRELGEFFDAGTVSRNPRVYKEYRDFIINKYREDPSRRITFTEIRKSLVGDVGAINRLFLFLDRWGLINFSASESKGAAVDNGGGGFPVVVEDGPPVGVKIVPFPNAGKGALSQSRSVLEKEGYVFKLPPLTSYSDVFGDRTMGYVCGNCGEHCVSGYYESKRGGFVICTKCFKTEKYGESKSADDFKFNDQINDSSNHVTNEWTDAETLCLLEAIVSKTPDWNLIANHVRRSRLDCIAKLIQLPFGEHMLGSINGKCDDKESASQRTDEPIQHTLTDMVQESIKPDFQHHENADGKEQIIEEGKMGPPLKRRCSASLADASDSLMEQVALLSTIAGPHVAAAAAEAAITTLCNESPYAKKVFKIDDDEVYDKLVSFAPNNNPTSDQKVEGVENEKQLKVSETSESIPGKNFGHLTFQVRAAAATAFGAVAAHAKLLADQEDREMEHLMASIVDMQLKKIQYKMKHFEELETIMEKQYTQIQQLKESILAEWIGISQQALSSGIPRWKDHGFSKSLLSTL